MSMKLIYVECLSLLASYRPVRISLQAGKNFLEIVENEILTRIAGESC